ncbi:TetR/AcrR family transcriptional regulator [Nocardioides allogilvus]|uniref:TetR/AcrR family transcriptional regulator n=1 Tax=Nocardioides allogilvus TaxID=2072017 RepID=UPI0018E591D8|nr:TetR/AcrR family transcriptional regulator [Nocardioides allogilvus]
MVYGARDFAGEPLFWAVARLIHRGGMSAVTVRAAAAEAGCSVGFMRHYYDNKSMLLACTYELVMDAQLHRLEEILWARKGMPEMFPTGAPPEEPLGPARAAELLATCLDQGEQRELLVGVQLSFHALAHHDGVLGGPVSSYHRRLQEDCMHVLREAGVPAPAIEAEAVDLWTLVIGLTALIPGLATEDPGRRIGSLTSEQVVGALRRHLEAAVARHAAPEPPALDVAG